jgi:hypothetical protein
LHARWAFGFSWKSWLGVLDDCAIEGSRAVDRARGISKELTVAKMVVSIVLVSLALYASWFVRLGDLTFREHVMRIAKTPEVHDLEVGIFTAVGSAKNAVKTKIASRLHQTRDGHVDPNAPAPDVNEIGPDDNRR